jgi:hypothetical protein
VLEVLLAAQTALPKQLACVRACTRMPHAYAAACACGRFVAR